MPKYSDKQIEVALRKGKGLKTIAARVLGCSSHTIDKRVAGSEHLQAVMVEERDALLDVAELKLVEKVQAGEAWAVQFMLKTLGKKRGYVERQEQELTGSVNHDHSGNIQHTHQFDHAAFSAVFVEVFGAVATNGIPESLDTPYTNGTAGRLLNGSSS